jgi:cytochrome c peroxidase
VHTSNSDQSAYHWYCMSISIPFLDTARPCKTRHIGLCVAFGLVALWAGHGRADDLGAQLFHDTQLSANAAISCATCHQAARAYSDGRSTALGLRLGARKTPSLLNIAQYQSYGWDGGSTQLWQQVLLPFVRPAEHGLSSLNFVLDTVNNAPRYQAVRGNRVLTEIDIGTALARYVLQHAAKPQPVQLSPQAGRGQVLFNHKAKCSQCHQPHTGFTDNRFHAALSGRFTPNARQQALIKSLRYQRVGPHYLRATDDFERAALGRFLVSLDPADVAFFRTPSLHHVSQMAPYGHAGQVADLTAVIVIEAQRSDVQLNDAELAALRAYLDTL